VIDGVVDCVDCVAGLKRVGHFQVVERALLWFSCHRPIWQAKLQSRQLQENLPNCDLNLQLMTLVSFSYLGCDIDND
jgi:hypothetical protein